jgi:hypothetical protein
MLSGFYKQLLNSGYTDKVTSKNTFAKRFMKLVKEHVRTRHQSRMGNYYES